MGNMEVIVSVLRNGSTKAECNHLSEKLESIALVPQKSRTLNSNSLHLNRSDKRMNKLNCLNGGCIIHFYINCDSAEVRKHTTFPQNMITNPPQSL